MHIAGSIFKLLSEEQTLYILEKVYRPYFDLVGEVVLRSLASPSAALQEEALQLWTFVSLETLPSLWEGVATVWEQIIVAAEKKEELMEVLKVFMASNGECGMYFSNLLTEGAALLRDKQVIQFVLKAIPWVCSQIMIYFGNSTHILSVGHLS